MAAGAELVDGWLMIGWLLMVFPSREVVTLHLW